MEKLQLLQSLTEFVLDVEKRLPEDKYISIDYMWHVNGVVITLSKQETCEVLESKTHYFGRTHGDSIEDIITWLQTL